MKAKRILSLLKSNGHELLMVITPKTGKGFATIARYFYGVGIQDIFFR
jgi:hypothetical protein